MPFLASSNDHLAARDSGELSWGPFGSCRGWTPIESWSGLCDQGGMGELFVGTVPGCSGVGNSEAHAGAGAERAPEEP
eukprot:8585956-Pyramimonas_sp.AAC.1